MNGDGTIVAFGVSVPWTGPMGRVLVYQYSGGSWSQLGNYIQSNYGDGLGYTQDSIALNEAGDIIAIGAERADMNAYTGKVGVYQYNSGTSTWDQLGSDIYGDNTGDRSGYSVSLNSSGNTVIFGATYDDSATLTDAGSVKVYQYDSGTTSWSQLGNSLYGEYTTARMGWDVDINSDGTIIVVGTIYDNDGGTMAGDARVFEYNSGTNNWDQLGSDIDGGSEYDQLGSQVSINSIGNFIAVGEKGTAGGVLFYHYSGGSWSQVGTTVANTNTTGHSGNAYYTIGETIALSKDNTIMIYGQEQMGMDNVMFSGQAGVYKLESTITQTYSYATNRSLVGIGVESPSYELDVSGNTNTTSLIVSSSAIMPISTPSSASDTGTTGQVAVDTDYVYVCTATNTWKRAALSTW
jgi:hypothetical protein